MINSHFLSIEATIRSAILFVLYMQLTSLVNRQADTEIMTDWLNNLLHG